MLYKHYCLHSISLSMWVESVQKSAYLLALLLVVADGREWDVQCTPPCTCDLTYFTDLPVATQWLKEDPPPQEHHQTNNEATYHDNEPQGDLLKMAMCVFQQGTDPQSVLAALPKDIQVLTVLQGRGYGGTALEADYFQDFQDLMVLDIQGFQQDDSMPTDRLVLRNDALQPLTSLRYLNLQNIKLLGHVKQDNRLHPMELAQVVGPSPRNSRKGRREKDPTKRRVVLLKPTDNEIPLVSYQEYKQEIERAGLTTFAGLSELLLLRVYACDLREVNWEMFKGLGKLQYLSLERNNLLFIPEFAFYGTPHLKTLSLAGNQLLSLQDTALAGLLELSHLDLSSNNFSHLSELSLPPFPELRTADFRNNPVEAVFPSTFEIMNATHVLYLGGNDSPLNLLPNSFLGLSSLKKLHISNIKVPLLERELLRGMAKLQKLVITGNIHTISFDAFLEVPKLENLVLNNCNITSVSMDAFYGLYGLISLDLSHNLLTWLPPGVFDQQFSLKELLLQNNKLTELPASIFTRVPAKMIRLDQNPWHCSCAMWEWQPSAINKVKVRALKTDGICQFSYDKGSECRGAVADRYVYDKRVAPRCATPLKYNNWNIFHLLRKELHCHKKQKKDRKAYLKKKHEDYEKSLNPEHTLDKYREIERMMEENRNVEGNNGTTGLRNKYVKPIPTQMADINISPEMELTPSRVDSGVEGGQRKPTETPSGQENENNSSHQSNNLQEDLISRPTEVGSEDNGDRATTIRVNSPSNVPIALSKPNMELAASANVDTGGESHLNKKAKQQLALQREKEEKAALKEKIKSEIPLGTNSDASKPEKALKKALKLDMEKKRIEKLKQVQL